MDEENKGERIGSPSPKGRRSAADDGHSLEDDKIWHAMRSTLRCRMLEAIRCSPGIDVRTLAASMRSTPQRLYYHLGILVKAHLIEERAGGGGVNHRGPAPVRYYPVGYNSAHDNSAHDGSAHDNSAHDGPAAPGEPDSIDERFYFATSKAAERAGRLVHMFAQEGLKQAVPTGSRGTPVAAGGLADFRSEALDDAEIREIERHIGAIQLVLGRARDRRRSTKAVVAATAFVGVCFARYTATVMPNGPVPFNGQSSRGEKASRDERASRDEKASRR